MMMKSYVGFCWGRVKSWCGLVGDRPQMVSWRPSLGDGDAIAGDFNGGSLARLFEAPALVPLPGGVLSSSVSEPREEGW